VNCGTSVDKMGVIQAPTPFHTQKVYGASMLNALNLSSTAATSVPPLFPGKGGVDDVSDDEGKEDYKEDFDD